MEVLGVLASSIALAQGIAAGRHVVKILRDIPEIQDDFESLRREMRAPKRVEIGRGIYTTSQLDRSDRRHCGRSQEGDWPDFNAAGYPKPAKRVASGPSGPATPEIFHELDIIVARCGREAEGKRMEARRREWLLQGNKMQKLREKASEAKSNLHFAFTCHNTVTLREQINSDLRQHFESFAFHLASRLTLEVSRRSGNLLEAPTPEIDASDDSRRFRKPNPAHARRRDEQAGMHAALSKSQVPLHFAVYDGGAAAVSLLLVAEAAADARDFFGRTPLHLPANTNCTASIDAMFELSLVASGVDLEAQDDGGATVAFRALRKNNLPFLRCRKKTQPLRGRGSFL
ncbi:hypothetical protein ACJZ2D_015920 [Fusarium nematophilum]